MLGAMAGTLMAQRRLARRPNVVLIYADDLGYGDLSCYGHPTIRTPNLDRLASDGMRFTQFYSAAPLCSPSRAALMTGRYPVRSGMNVVLFPDSTGGLPDSETTVAELLKAKGYRTGIVGKWHLGHLPRYLPTRHGFDSYFGIPYSNDMSLKTNGVYDEIAELQGRKRPPGAMKRYESLPGVALMRDEEVIDRDPDQAQLTPRYTAEAVNFIKAGATARQPFFLYFPHTFPHVPLYASARFRGKSKRGLYGDAVEELDWSVGEVMRTIRELKLEEDTLVLFSSDNGGAVNLGTHGGSNGALREGKGTTWEGGVREPFIAAWKGRIAPGQVSSEIASTMDVFPTLARLADAPIRPGREIDGADLGPVLFEGKTRPQRDLHYYHAGQWRAMRRGPWKLHRLIAPTSADRFVLHNIEEDPAERYDLAERHAELAATLKSAMEQHIASVARGEEQR
jgi:arylsulfatase A-like enzyme